MPVVDRGPGHETAALIGVEGLPGRQGQHLGFSRIGRPVFSASAGQFFLHQKSGFSCIRKPVFPALESRHLLH
jgi:hypothetical protein